MRKIELLAPARDAAVGIEAINHGADAVYIGAPLFSARVAAGCSVADIERLAAHAHRYGARAIVALNTILRDEELLQAQTIIRQLWEAGADALIVQDMGILRLDLPPIPLHASTQMDTRTPQKAQLLQSLGFQRIVVARELSLAQIRAIADAVTVDIECFVHGALCVSVSGQCYMSACLNGRSANRGTCAQTCRLPMDLYDANGRPIVRQKHLLSLRDMNRSRHLRELIDAGVSSLKIEGRLKDMAYVKNVTAFYRQLLDRILSERDDCAPLSDGACVYTFDPDPAASFNRGFTDYYLLGNRETKESPSPQPVWNFLTPKSMGEKLGRVVRVMRDSFEVDTRADIHNGDGLMAVAQSDLNALDNSLLGFRLNRWDPQRRQVFPLGGTQVTRQLRPGMEIWRNASSAFEQLLSRRSAERRIPVDLVFRVSATEMTLTLTDPHGLSAGASTNVADTPFALAQRPQRDNYQRQLSKLGDTIFSPRSFTLSSSVDYFVPSSFLNDLRRRAVEALEREREAQRLRLRPEAPLRPEVGPCPEASCLPDDIRANVLNAKAREVYRSLGHPDVAPAFEESGQLGDAPVMLTRHCLRYALGQCPRFPLPAVSPAAFPKGDFPLPWTLKIGDKKFSIRFGCNNDCMTEIGAPQGSAPQRQAPQGGM